MKKPLIILSKISFHRTRTRTHLVIEPDRTEPIKYGFFSHLQSRSFSALRCVKTYLTLATTLLMPRAQTITPTLTTNTSYITVIDIASNKTLQYIYAAVYVNVH